MKLKILWFRSNRILILEKIMNLQISIGLSLLYQTWSKTLVISSAYYSGLQTNGPTQLLILFPAQHSGRLNPGGQCLSDCPGFWQDHPASLEDVKLFYNCFDLRLPQQRFLLDKTCWMALQAYKVRQCSLFSKCWHWFELCCKPQPTQLLAGLWTLI